MNMTDVATNKKLNIGLWAAQLVLALDFGMFGMMKATQPVDQLGTSINRMI
jgi:hypothetical protein